MHKNVSVGPIWSFDRCSFDRCSLFGVFLCLNLRIFVLLSEYSSAMQHVSIIKRSFEILHHTSLHCSMRTLPLYIFLAIMPPIFSKPNQLGIHIITRPRHHTKQFVRATLAEGLGITDGSSLKKNDDNGAGVTKTSKAMHATQDMYELSARLGSAEATAENVV